MITQQTVALIDRARDPLAAVLLMCERGRGALVKAASVVEAREVLAGISTLEHAVKVRDMNQDAVIAASTLRIRAERRVGELLREQDRKSGRPKILAPCEDSPTLKEQGLTYSDSSRYQRLAAVPEDTFETAIGHVAQDARELRISVTREAVMRAIDPAGERRPDERLRDADQFKRACDLVTERAEAAVFAIQFGYFPGTLGPVGVLALSQAIKVAREAIARVEQQLHQRRHRR